ncbi:MAG: hypothetical protein V4773_14935 [Verrucomicrobiota bacterium]
MKITPVIGFGLLLTAVIAFAAQAVAPIPAALGPAEFTDGDSIVIEEILGTSPAMEIGDRVLVRGRYTLASQAEAKLGLSLTRTQVKVPVPILPGSNKRVAKGSGKFELVYDVSQIGCLRAGFSSLEDGKSFGTVFFGTPEQLARVKRSPERWIK